MSVCKGCGITLQTENPKELGYTPKRDSEYCQRCFRLIHYDDLIYSMKTGIDPDLVFERIEQMDGVVLWVVDLFDFESGMIPGITRKIKDKQIVFVGTKRDLLPDTISDSKLEHFIYRRLKEHGISVSAVLWTGMNDTLTFETLRDSLSQVTDQKKVIVVGRANAGKSTFLNRLLNQQRLTSSRYPGTTLEFQEIEIDDITLIDTPGIEANHNLMLHVAEKDLKTLVPHKKLKPAIYQLYGNQSFFLGGLVRVDFNQCEKATAVFYISEELPLHRTKCENAVTQWQSHQWKPTCSITDFSHVKIKKEEEKMDIVVDGLGWICVSGAISTIDVYVPKGINYTFRKAMI